MRFAIQLSITCTVFTLRGQQHVASCQEFPFEVRMYDKVVWLKISIRLFSKKLTLDKILVRVSKVINLHSRN